MSIAAISSSTLDEDFLERGRISSRSAGSEEQTARRSQEPARRGHVRLLRVRRARRTGQEPARYAPLGYSVRQKEALPRFFDEGRLEMTNHSERPTQGHHRAASLFVGSGDQCHTENLLSLIGSARLLRLDCGAYLRDVFRVIPHWPL